jgi:hypothetical protein
MGVTFSTTDGDYATNYLKGISKNPNKLRALPRGEIVQNFF